MKLMREIRFLATDPENIAGEVNTWAGPISREVTDPLWLARAIVEGPADERTGYLCDIHLIDAMMRDVLLPRLVEKVKGPHAGVGDVAAALLDLFPVLAARLAPPAILSSLTLKLSPYTGLTADQGDRLMVRLTRTFEFSAAHRLFCGDLSDDENRRVFGKCSNPLGHGHNYVLEVTVGGSPDEVRGTLVDPPGFDLIVKERVIDRFDHSNLNTECAEFSSLNPTVENIARVIYELLVGAFDRCELRSVRVWETPKTYAEYSGGD